MAYALHNTARSLLMQIPTRQGIENFQGEYTMKKPHVLFAQRYSIFTLAVTLAAPGAATGQATGSEASPDAASETVDISATDAAPEASVVDRMTDGQILQVIRVLSEGEIRQAEMAMDQSGNEDVKMAAQMIISDHTSTNEQIASLADADLELEDSALSDGLKSLTEVTMENLASLEGLAFDCQFLKEQVDQHQLAIDTLSSHLLPNAQDVKVREFLTMTSPSLEHHLNTARQGMENIGECSQDV